MKFSFRSDYCELAHPRILDALKAVGTAQFEGYGLDEYSLKAAQLIKDKINSKVADVHFVSGGTQANLLVLSSALRPHEAVISSHSGHIFVHEAGSVEATGHKVCTAVSDDGKLYPDAIEAIVEEHCDEHMVLPRIVYISQSTETGLVYTRKDLAAISDVCKKHNLFLYIDGARLGAALCSSACDLSYSDLARFADAFYIGGTKNGALYGEAIVIVNDALKRDFRYLIKQRGALLSKGAAIGVQFEAMFTDGLYEQIASSANAAALRLADGIKNAGFSFLYPVQTNMLFPTFPANLAARLHERFEFYDWTKSGDMITARLLTSWATPESAIDGFLGVIKG